MLSHLSSFSIFHYPFSIIFHGATVPNEMKVPLRLGERQPMILVARLIRLAFDIVINLPAAHGADIPHEGFSGISCAAARTRLGRCFRQPVKAVRLVLPDTASGRKYGSSSSLVLLLLHAAEKRLRQKRHTRPYSISISTGQ